MNRKSFNIKNVAIIGMLVAIISVASQISIPMPSMVPLTVQILPIAIAGYLLGAKYATLTVVVYMCLGALGAPVFASFKGGIYVLFGYTGGFIWGFIIIAIICGIFNEKSILALPLGMVAVILSHITGIIQYMNIAKVDFISSFLLVSLPYLIKDLLLVPIAYYMSQKIKKQIKIKTHMS